MTKVEIIKPDEIIQALVDGAEVLHIDLSEYTGNDMAVRCTRLTSRVFNNILKAIKVADKDEDIFIKLMEIEEENEKGEEENEE